MKYIPDEVGRCILTNPGATAADISDLTGVGGTALIEILRNLLANDYVRRVAKPLGNEWAKYYPTAKLRDIFPDLKDCQVMNDNGEWSEYDDVF